MDTLAGYEEWGSVIKREGGRQGEKKGWRGRGGGRCSLDALDTCRLVGSKVPLVYHKLQLASVEGKRNKQKRIISGCQNRYPFVVAHPIICSCANQSHSYTYTCTLDMFLDRVTATPKTWVLWICRLFFFPSLVVVVGGGGVGGGARICFCFCFCFCFVSGFGSYGYYPCCCCCFCIQKFHQNLLVSCCDFFRSL